MLAPDQTRQQAVFDRLRQGILAGSLPAGSRLPPTRALAGELGVARQTVVLAYERLAAEGYVRARTGSGTYVAPDLPDAAPAPAAPPATAASALSRRGAMLAAVPVTATTRDAGSGMLLAGGLAGARPVPRRRLGALHRPRAEGAAGRAVPAIRRRKACPTCAHRSPRIWRRPAAWPPTPAASSSPPAPSRRCASPPSCCWTPATRPGSRIPATSPAAAP